ncbi:MAG: hypothetical protein JNM69_25955 [Archangium sp.]|nr:hypothetical protein [Archangium sp.]
MRALLLLLLSSSSFAGPVLVDRVAAIVDGQLVFQSQVEKRASAQKVSRQVARAELIDALLITKDAHLTTSESEIDRALDTILKENNLSRADFKDLLERQGSSLAEYREQIGFQLLEMRWLLAHANGASLQADDVRLALREKLLTQLRKRAVVEVFE